MSNIADPGDSAAHLEAIQNVYGNAPRRSNWFAVTQDMINQFCDITGDNAWIHVDPERAGRESPFGGCIAPGFWLLAMLPQLARTAMGDDWLPTGLLAINYGFDRVRFTGPVLIGARVRLASKLIDVTVRERGRYLVRTESIIEVDGRDQPALVAEWLFLLVDHS